MAITGVEWRKDVFRCFVFFRFIFLIFSFYIYHKILSTIGRMCELFIGIERNTFSVSAFNYFILQLKKTIRPFLFFSVVE